MCPNMMVSASEGTALLTTTVVHHIFRSVRQPGADTSSGASTVVNTAGTISVRTPIAIETIQRIYTRNSLQQKPNFAFFFEYHIRNQNIKNNE